MTKVIFIDTGPLGKITHPRAEKNSRYVDLIKYAHARDYQLVIPEIADYELRREYLLNKNQKSLDRLDNLKTLLIFAPITSNVMKRAAELWAEARLRHTPTADKKELDGDVILAAEAQLFDESNSAIVLTENIGHLGQFVTVKTVEEIL